MIFGMWLFEMRSDQILDGSVSLNDRGKVSKAREFNISAGASGHSKV